MKKTEKAKRTLVVLGLAGLLLVATKFYFGYHYYYAYEEARKQAKSIESAFPELEKNLKKAVGFYGNSVFLDELGRLYYDMALAKNKEGVEDRRDFYLDLAKETFERRISKNSVDAFGYFDLGRVYLLYNYPLLTYKEKARRLFRNALELKPADEYLNVNIIYIYLTQWESLTASEKSFIKACLQDVLKYNEMFIPRISNLWKRNFGNIDRLKDIFSKDEELWPRLNQHF